LIAPESGMSLPRRIIRSKLIWRHNNLDNTNKEPVENPIWPRPVLTLVPVKWSALNEPVLSLTGAWKFTMTAPQNYWENSVNPEQWDDVPVPAELFALGYDIRRNKEYVYKKQIQIPAEWVGMTVILKIGMAYEYSKIWAG